MRNDMNHLENIEKLQKEADQIAKEFELTCRVMLRRTGAIRDHEGNYIINEQDLLAWFRNGDHLRNYTDWDSF